ncbi:MAG: AbrB/MazE/SpoVT family DNA-binding domain-containing protein [Candidatus Lokiarchaeota archaeon]|nr:AbrB/MazE/SpoVT family DNA-binding domain-containing protein [Candidatus Lokiarchaeota archaeon]MBD3201555.1 AbrB/MazE/SpoVT family DNA-binding domain-containing protein [Candidatus Lokiarchaeota archaeon]
MGYNIETRKVQQTGGSSFIISLPKPWVEKSNIKPKDTLGILAQPDGNLLITPKINSEDILKTKKFLADNYEDYNFLFRVLIGAYVMGYSRIEVKASKKFEPHIRDCVIDFTQITIGPEIIEESNTFIVIKDLLNPKEMPFDKTIKRMYILAESMHEDAMRALKNNNRGLAEEVMKRDNDIDRLHWLISRQSSIVLRDIILSQKMGITLEDANHYQLMSRFLERIADHAVKIAKNVLLILEYDLEEPLIKKIAKTSEYSLKLLNNSLDARMNKDIKMANENIASVEKLVSMCEQISLDLNGNHVESSIAIGYIIESIRRTGEYAGDISEIIINKLINEDN